MLNDIKMPPPEPPDDPRRPGTVPALSPAVAPAIAPGAVRPAVRVETGPTGLPHHAAPHVDPNEPGLHHARVMGEPTRIDPIYAMPMEDRGSYFSLMLSAVVVAVFCVLLLVVWWTFFHTAAAA